MPATVLICQLNCVVTPLTTLLRDVVRYVRDTAHFNGGKPPSRHAARRLREKALPPGTCRWETAGMTTKRLPFPVPDERAHSSSPPTPICTTSLRNWSCPTACPRPRRRSCVRRASCCASRTTATSLHRGGHALPDRSGDRLEWLTSTCQSVGRFGAVEVEALESCWSRPNSSAWSSPPSTRTSTATSSPPSCGPRPRVLRGPRFVLECYPQVPNFQPDQPPL